MIDYIIWLPLVIALVAGVWFFTRRQAAPKKDPVFVQAIDRFTTLVHETSLNYNADVAPGDEAMENLNEAAADVSAETKQDVETLAMLWREMASQVRDFQQQPTSGTLQSSILTTRLAKQRDVINNLAETVRNRYE